MASRKVALPGSVSSARLRIPVGARCEHWLMIAVTSADVSGSAGYFRPLLGAGWPGCCPNRPAAC